MTKSSCLIKVDFDLHLSLLSVLEFGRLGNLLVNFRKFLDFRLRQRDFFVAVQNAQFLDDCVLNYTILGCRKTAANRTPDC